MVGPVLLNLLSGGQYFQLRFRLRQVTLDFGELLGELRELPVEGFETRSHGNAHSERDEREEKADHQEYSFHDPHRVPVDRRKVREGKSRAAY